jgi:hypothetical protein
MRGGPVVILGRKGADKLAFSGDGHTVAWPSDSGIEFWDLTDPESPVFRATLPTEGTRNFDLLSFGSLAFSHDGRLLAVLANNSVDLWDTDPERLVPTLCASVGDPITPEQWKQYVPNLPYQPPCRKM